MCEHVANGKQAVGWVVRHATALSCASRDGTVLCLTSADLEPLNDKTRNLQPLKSRQRLRVQESL